MLGFAKAVSFFLGPMFTLFPILYTLIAKFSQDHSYILKWTLFSYMFVLIVALFVIIGVMIGAFSNFDVSKREQRPLLFAFSAIVMLCYLISIFIFNGPKSLFIALFAVILGLISVVIVNKWTKASIHLATLTSATLFIGVVYGGYFFLFLTLIPLLAWARVKMKEHTPKETIIGTILGIVITLIVYLISKQFLLKMIIS
jgi:hypothetical protein